MEKHTDAALPPAGRTPPAGGRAAPARPAVQEWRPYRSLISFLPEASNREALDFARVEAPRAWGDETPEEGAAAHAGGHPGMGRALWYSSLPGLWRGRRGIWWCVTEGPHPVTCLPSLAGIIDELVGNSPSTKDAPQKGEQSPQTVNPSSVWCSGRIGASRIYLSGSAPVSAWLPPESTPARDEQIIQWARCRERGPGSGRSLFATGPRGWVTGLITGTGVFIWTLVAVLSLRVPVSTGSHSAPANGAQLAWRRAVLSAVTYLHKHPTAHVAKFKAKNGFWDVSYVSLPPIEPVTAAPIHRHPKKGPGRLKSGRMAPRTDRLLRREHQRMENRSTPPPIVRPPKGTRP
jgi:hypothetical protein